MTKRLQSVSSVWRATPLVFRVLMHLFAAIVCVFGIVSIANVQSINVVEAKISYDSEEFEFIELPYRKNFIGDYWVRLEIDARDSGASVRIFPDDELLEFSINGSEEDLSKYSRQQKRNYSSGFSMDLSLLEDEKNTLVFKLNNKSNPSGFNFISERSISLHQGSLLVLVLFSYALFLSLSLPVTKGQMVIACASIIACVVYLSATGERTRIFDVYEGGGHKDYIEHVAENWTLPDPGKGWEYHQPPLYYGIAAAARNIFVDDPQSSDLWGRVLALWFWVVFIMASLAVLKIGLPGAYKVLILVSLLFAFWPAGIIHSVRIGNDNPVYMFCGLAFYYIVKWWNSGRREDIVWASLWIFASIITKSNGLILASVLFGLIFFRAFGHAWLAKRILEFWHRAWCPSLIAVGFAVLGIVLNLGDNYYKYLIGESEDWLLSNVSTTINAGLKVENGILNYIIFDLSTFLQSAFISTWEDQYGRQYFWNFVLRSSLTSEFFFDGVAMAVWGILNGVMLLMLIGAMLFVFGKRLESPSHGLITVTYRYLPWIFLLLASIFFLLAYRIKVPLSCNTDFRYIYMCLISVVFFAALSIRSKGAIGRYGSYVPAVGIPLATVVWLGMLV